MNPVKINHLAAIVCIVALHVLGFLWYGPLFGEAWMGMIGVTMESMEANPPSNMIWVTNFIASAASVYVLAWILAKLGITSGVNGAGVAFLLTLCLHVLVVVNGNMFAQAPAGLGWITGGFSLVGNTISGFILGAWVKK